ncbi:MAG: site-2 protease family protein, partial [Candidatus Rokuibacteriota bacterium]
MALPGPARPPRALAQAEATESGRPLFGVPVRLDVSCVFGLALTTWTLADAVLPLAADGRPVTAYWAAGGLTALALLASVAMHEMAHGLAARRAGIRVRRVTLSLFGGATVLDGRVPTARAQLTIAMAGPLASLALAVGAAIVHVTLVEIGGDELGVVASAVVAVANLGIAAINLFPAPPLDGGLVLYAALARLPWTRSHAAGVAAAAG